MNYSKYNNISKTEKTLFITCSLILIILFIFAFKVDTMAGDTLTDLQSIHKETLQVNAEVNEAIYNVRSAYDIIHNRAVNLTPQTDFTIKSDELTGNILTLTNDCIELENELRLEIKQAKINNYIVTRKFPITELEILYRIVEAEATSGTIEQKQNVAWCIINRIDDNYFPNTITDVVFDYFLDPNDGHKIYQFSPVYDGRYYTVHITDSTRQAVQLALQGMGQHNGTFFVAPTIADPDNLSWFETSLTKLFTDGIHDYYR